MHRRYGCVGRRRRVIPSSFSQEPPDRLQIVHMIADHFDRHHHRHREQQPHTPHAQLQNSSPTKTATRFIDATLPISVGVSSQPSSEVMSERDSRDDEHHVDRAELKKRDDREPSADDERAVVTEWN